MLPALRVLFLSQNKQRILPCATFSDGFLDGFTKSRKTLISCVMFVCPSVRPLGKNPLPQDGFSFYFTFEYFWKICQENASFIKILQE
jgi:hypothetical protein